jgi:membrane fusion protein (multidrug efflux system)
VRVLDNQRVNAGDVIVEIDPRDLQARVDESQAAVDLAQAERNAAISTLELTKATTAAALEQAQAEVNAAQAAVDQARAEYAAAQSELERARADLSRYEQIAGPAVSQQQVDLARATAQRADAQTEAARKAVTAAQAQVAAAQGRLIAAQAAPYQVAAADSQVKRAGATVNQAQAALREAQLQLSYTTITAPQAGRITKRSVEAGNYVVDGQTLLAIVTDDLWTEANFKETQLADMRPGQDVSIRIDAFPDENFRGHVDSIQAGGGAYFSLLPPENATGNFVKVVQRVPVKIVFDQPLDLNRFAIGPGMSAVPKVKVK